MERTTAEEKKIYNDYFNKLYGKGGKYEPLDPQIIKKYNIDQTQSAIPVISATEEMFGKYKNTGVAGSKQQKYVNAIIAAAKQNKIPNGTLIDFNYGWQEGKVGICIL